MKRNILDGTTDEAGSYAWYRYNETSGNYELIPGEDGPQLRVTESGDYRLVVTDIIEDSTDQEDVRVTFYDKPVAGEATDVYVCSSGAETVDLTVNSEGILNGADAAKHEVVYYESMEDFENNESIANVENFTYVEGVSLFAAVRDMQSGCLSDPVSFQLKSFDFSESGLNENTVICVDLDGNILASITVGKDLGTDYIYEWSNNDGVLSDEPVIQFSEFPDLTDLSLRLISKQTNCELIINTRLVAVSRPTSVSVDIQGSDFGDGYIVTANLGAGIGEDFADYEFQLDNSEWQESNTFNAVSPGDHIINVRETHGCGLVTSARFYLIGYPRYFTPNSDGYNDTWHIINDSFLSVKKLYVFDRYGKLIKQLEPKGGEGWDGTFNGRDLPADDYWFRVEFEDQRTGEYVQYSSNFSLIR
ncbi:T9SS type B sorting domain-containing protein [Christiangramia salexigens]|uniref:T9SS type B sorting domain-containing protein n=1 Tax=Christiangramia salexigens TaxID=1913577 RepID=A0A1L3J7Z6_9FLAO|nr:T9SS type B sorting domain-containing protein [Christiangramia salexigens]APG61248.1 hypothetical protein LPB144_12900 [Christiangramia salexigens]